MRVRTNMAVAIGLVAAGALAWAPGCATDETPIPSEPVGAAALAGTWDIVRAGAQDVADVLPEGAREPMLTLEETGAYSGFAGVNQFSGTYDTEALALGLWEGGPVVTTKMAGPPALMALERSIVSGLEEADALVHTGGSVVFTDEGEEMLVLRRRGDSSPLP